jgi:hypothetical protein
MGLLWRARKTLGTAFRPHARALALAAALPAGTNLAYTFGLVRPWGMLDLTPFSFTLSGVVLAWGVLRNGLFDLIGVQQLSLIRAARGCQYTGAGRVFQKDLIDHLTVNFFGLDFG